MDTVGKCMVISLIAGSLLLTTGLIWNAVVSPMVIDQFAKGGSSLPFSDDERVLEGNMGLPSLAWGKDSEEFEDRMFDLTSSDFTLVTESVFVTSHGLFSSNDGELLMHQDLKANSSKDPSFPIGGLKKKDYPIYSSFLNESTDAAYSGTKIIDGNEVYTYDINIENEPIDIHGMKLEGGFDFSDENLPIDEDIPFYYSDSTQYLMDPRTSVPLDIRLNLSVDLMFPDFHHLQALKENVSFALETTRSPSQTNPGTYDETTLLVARYFAGEIDRNDPNNAIFNERFVYYDLETGEPLPPDQQGTSSTYVVDRTDFRYVTGYMGTERSGYYQFPIANAEAKDYPMWDVITSTERVAEYKGQSSSGNKVYEMVMEDGKLDIDNLLLPIQLTPFRTYIMDSTQTWEIDDVSGTMLNYSIRGTVYVRFSSPLGTREEEVASFEMDLCKNTTDTLLKVARLFKELLLPLSGDRIVAFSLQASFTDSAIRKMIGLSDDVAIYLTLLRKVTPWVEVGLGIVIMVVPVVIYGVRRHRRNKTVIFERV